MSVIQKDSWWMLAEKDDEEIVVGMCNKCHQEKNIGWYWPGAEKGYGDYDFKCTFCNDIIHQRKETYEETKEIL